MAQRALITGITGQDGSYLAELLFAKGYEVHGLFRPEEGAGHIPSATFAELKIHRGLVDSHEDVIRAIQNSSPDECYHLAAQSFVMGEEFTTMRTNVTGTHHVLAAIREHARDCRLFLAGSSEVFGDVDHSPQTEATPMRPRSIYGISKLSGLLLLRHYRETHGIHASCGILYNHESPRRGEQFVTRKITRAAARIRAGLENELRLGNLDAIRDWGDARDYVEAMWLMLQQPHPDDYVIASGKPRTVRQFLDAAFAAAGIPWEEFVVVDPQFYRPAEKYPMTGDASKARVQLGWTTKRTFEDLVTEMVQQDIASLGRN